MDPDLPSVLRSAIEVAYDVDVGYSNPADVGYSNPADPGQPQAMSDFRTSSVECIVLFVYEELVKVPWNNLSRSTQQMKF